jgi:hypothetical protein
MTSLRFSRDDEDGRPVGRSPPNIFAKLFQISVVPIPSFSKDSLGGFVGFQGVTRRSKFIYAVQIFGLSASETTQRIWATRCGLLKGTCKHSSMSLVFQKEKFDDSEFNNQRTAIHYV